MKHTLWLFAISCLLTFFSNAEMLFWQLNNDSYQLIQDNNIYQMNYFVLDSSGKTVATGKANNHPDFSFMSDHQWEFTWNNDWNDQSYSFFIELVNSDNNRWVSDTANYKDIVSSGAVRYVGVFNTSYFHGFNNYRPVSSPEPNSGMLCIIGLCTLLLKRGKKGNIG